MTDPIAIAAAITTAPAFAKLGLSMRDPRTRDRAGQELASWIAQQLDGREPPHPGQLRLPL